MFQLLAWATTPFLTLVCCVSRLPDDKHCLYTVTSENYYPLLTDIFRDS